ncbi:hypothetical protein DPMN_076524 [Dreissena polymorpha]|uniref:Uncharacterized protein n=1 Tax=Dreissena polymorpha TaxID=45954 RepID=A0A9D4BFU4_DREPO|nr:hypothetical protein DPMN_076524 [Dreissena polymorpha]
MLFQVLSSVKEHMSELLKTVYSRVSLDETVAHEVMSTILAAVFAEMDHSSKQVQIAFQYMIFILGKLG